MQIPLFFGVIFFASPIQFLGMETGLKPVLFLSNHTDYNLPTHYKKYLILKTLT